MKQVIARMTSFKASFNLIIFYLIATGGGKSAATSDHERVLYNVALQDLKTKCTASHSYRKPVTGYQSKCDYLFDGKTRGDDYWSPAEQTTGPRWIELLFPQPYDLVQVRMRHYNWDNTAGAKEVSVTLFSSDGQVIQNDTVIHFETSGFDTWKEANFRRTTTMAMRALITITKEYDPGYTGFDEIEFLTTFEGISLVNVASTKYGSTCKASINEYFCEDAISGVLNQFWQFGTAASAIGTWIEIIFPQSYFISQIRMLPYNEQSSGIKDSLVTLWNMDDGIVDNSTILTFKSGDYGWAEVNFSNPKGPVKRARITIISQYSTYSRINEIQFFHQYKDVLTKDGKICVFPDFNNSDSCFYSRYSFEYLCKVGTDAATHICVFPDTTSCDKSIRLHPFLGPPNIGDYWCQGQGGCYSGTTERCHQDQFSPVITVDATPANEGQNITFNCSLVAIPAVTRNQITVTVYDGSKSIDITIQSVTETEVQTHLSYITRQAVTANAIIQCTAYNTLGSSSKSARPTLYELPFLRQSLMVISITATSIMVSWNAWNNGLDGGNGPAERYFLVSRQGGNEWKTLHHEETSKKKKVPTATLR